MLMKHCGHFNVRKYRDIKDSDKYITLDILLKFGSLDNIRIISSEPKDNLGRSGKGLINSFGLKAKASTKKSTKGKLFHRKCHYAGPLKFYQGV